MAPAALVSTYFGTQICHPTEVRTARYSIFADDNTSPNVSTCRRMRPSWIIAIRPGEMVSRDGVMDF